MKKITLSFSILAASAVLIVAGCKKTKPEAPVADTELQSSVDAVFALYTITDAEMISSFIGDNSTAFPAFYAPMAGSTATFVADTLTSQTNIQFDNTICADGLLRTGTVFVDRARVNPLTGLDYNPHATPNSRYYHTVGYAERLTLLDYKVNGWRLVTMDYAYVTEGQPCIVLNLIPSDSYNTSTTNLQWSIKGSFKLTRGTDSMVVQVDLVKTLLSTSSLIVFPTKTSPINWTQARVSYTGHASGITLNGAPFTMDISNDHAVIRDFTCSPDPISSVSVSSSTVTPITQTTSQYHPFVDGIATFKTAQLYPRQIYFAGSDGAGVPCDNSGAVLIKGISYPIDFRKQ